MDSDGTGGRNYRDLIVWQKAMELAESIYASTRPFPKEEMYGLTAQMRRAAVSIPSNIAEGQGRGGERELVHFLHVAHGSLRELETQTMLAARFGYLPPDAVDRLLALAGEVGRLINGLIRSKA